jgi:uncharacterized protein
MIRGTIFAVALLLSACTAANGGNAPGCNPGEARGLSEAGLEQVELCVTSGGKERAFTVEIAATQPQQAKGMMFPLAQTRMASFWMKNTPLPLDIIFILPDGSIDTIGENAIPYSLDHVESTQPVAAVLELRGGLTGELGIVAGDKVRWK